MYRVPESGKTPTSKYRVTNRDHQTTRIMEVLVEELMRD
jgi:hypothetical protein